MITGVRNSTTNTLARSTSANHAHQGRHSSSTILQTKWSTRVKDLWRRTEIKSMMNISIYYGLVRYVGWVEGGERFAKNGDEVNDEHFNALYICYQSGMWVEGSKGKISAGFIITRPSM